MASKLEKELTEPYTAWKAGKSPTTNKAMLTALQPSIDKAINIHVPGQNNPLLQGQARLMALRSLDNYDPKQAALGTHVINTLQGLKRQNKKQTDLIRVPERAAQLHGAIMGATRSLQEEHGYEPNDSQIADHLGINLSQVRKMQNFHHGLSEGSFGDDGIYSEAAGKPIHSLTIDLVADDLGKMDRHILDHTLGINGKSVLPTSELARKLKVSDGYISQRRRSIQQMLDRVQYLSK